MTEVILAQTESSVFHGYAPGMSAPTSFSIYIGSIEVLENVQRSQFLYDHPESNPWVYNDAIRGWTWKFWMVNEPNGYDYYPSMHVEVNAPSAEVIPAVSPFTSLYGFRWERIAVDAMVGVSVVSTLTSESNVIVVGQDGGKLGIPVRPYPAGPYNAHVAIISTQSGGALGLLNPVIEVEIE